MSECVIERVRETRRDETRRGREKRKKEKEEEMEREKRIKEGILLLLSGSETLNQQINLMELPLPFRIQERPQIEPVDERRDRRGEGKEKGPVVIRGVALCVIGRSESGDFVAIHGIGAEEMLYFLCDLEEGEKMRIGEKRGKKETEGADKKEDERGKRTKMEGQKDQRDETRKKKICAEEVKEGERQENGKSKRGKRIPQLVVNEAIPSIKS